MTITEELKKRVKVIRANNVYEVRIAIGGGWFYEEIPILKDDTEQTLKTKAENVLENLFNDFHYSHNSKIEQQDILDDDGKPTGEKQDVFVIIDKFKDTLPREIKI